MTNDPKAETTKPASIKDTWIPYVVVCFVLIFALGLICAPMAIVDVISVGKSSVAVLEHQIETACLAYKAEYGTLPATSENYRLIKILKKDNPRGIAFLDTNPKDVNTNGELIDPWGTPLRITFDSNSKVHAISAGPDKVFGTPDDVTNQP